MSNQRTKECYRNYVLLSAFNKGKFRGRIWKNKKKIHDIEGLSVDAVFSTLKDMVDDIIDKKVRERGGACPKAKEYIAAFKAIMGVIHVGQFAMLKAHYNAPDRSMTATQLAHAANYAGYESANLQYGMLGDKLNAELNMELPKTNDGKPIRTFVLATGNDFETDEGEWIWVMRPEVAEAVEYFGLND